jgi:hypothetical protein
MTNVGSFAFPFIIVQVFFEVQYTTPRRANDVVVFGKIIDKQAITVVRQVFITRIGHWLSTARLFGRVRNLTTKFF